MAKKREVKKRSTNSNKKISGNLISRNYKLALNDLRELKIYFWFSFILFFLIIFLGFLFPVFFVEDILKIIGDLINQTEGLGTFELIRFITANNIQSAFLGMILGVFLGVFPIGVIVVNGYILGFVSNMVAGSEGLLALTMLLPHGIFEIPAIIIAVALGIRLGFLVMHKVIVQRKIKVGWEILLISLSVVFWPIAFIIYMAFTFINPDLRIKFFNSLKYSFRIFIFVVIPLLVIAGLIEGGLMGLLR